MSGSAQLRAGGKLLQHGTVLLEVGDYESWSRVLRVPVEALRKVVAGLRDLGYSVGEHELAASLREAFEELLGVKLEEGGLTPEEEELARDLEERRYGLPAGRGDEGL